jgi:hypothetical protein
MIYHAFHLDPATGRPALDYWAVHAETLTPVRVIGSTPPRVVLHVVAPEPFPGPVFTSHPDAAFDPAAIRHEVIADIRRHLAPTARTKITQATCLPPSEADLPEHLLVFDGAGEHPAIFRTRFPRIIIPVRPDDEEILDTPSHWVAREDLTAHGWEYFWTGCQQALDQLAPALIAAHED